MVDGFAVGNSPIAFKQMDLKDKTIVMMTTTNGTKAINLASGAKTVVIGSLPQPFTALTDWLLKQNENVLLLCSDETTSSTWRTAYSPVR